MQSRTRTSEKEVSPQARPISSELTELGEISSCVTKGKSRDALAEEVADLLILVMGTAIAQEFDLNQAFWGKMEKLMQRKSRIVDGRVRVSEFRDME